ncbi:MAG: hypothetical protein HY680_04560 [Chloroflexi bacterium]|nr:hypothetical protein [Chloroflexota bacterium]
MSALRRARQAQTRDLGASLTREAQASHRRVRGSLAQMEGRRLGEAARWRSHRLSRLRAMVRDVHALRQDAQSVLAMARASRREGAHQVSQQLGREVAAVRSAVSQMRASAEQERSAAQADLAQARNLWRRLPSLVVPAPARQVEPGAEPAREEPDESLVSRIFDDVANHPDGVRARELETRLAANRFQMMRALRTLLEEGKVRREEGVYFAR